MASKEELDNQKSINKAVKDQTKAIKDQTNALKAQTDLLDKKMSLEEESVRNIRGFSNQLREQSKDLIFQKQERSEILSIGRSLNKIAQSTSSINIKDASTLKGVNNILQNKVKLQKILNDLDSVGGDLTELSIERQEYLKTVFEEIGVESGNINDVLSKQLELSRQVSKNLTPRIFQGFSDFAKQIPGLGQLAAPLEDAADAAREVLLTSKLLKQIRKEDEGRLKTGKGLTLEVLKRLGLEEKLKELTGKDAADKAKELGISEAAIEIEGLPSKLSPVIKGFGKLKGLAGKGLGGSFFALLGSQLLVVNEQTVEFQKSLALSAGEAADLRNRFASAAVSSENINISTTALLETVSALSKQFGFPTLFDMETLVTTTKLTKQVGISAESAGMLAAATVTTGKNFEDQYKDALGTSYELQRQSGVQLDLRNILEESGKVTGTIRANLGSNVESIAAAVTQAKLFGGSLDDVANASKSLLDFESSITAELEAELLLGKNINLETARQASLNGDLATVAKELTKEAGDYTEFSKMNVIQQEALAKAMGMQSDQLADILFQQDIQGKTANELRALGKEELADRLEAQTAQEKFTASVAKLKGLLGDAVTAFMPFLDVLGSVFSLVGMIAKVLSPILNLFIGKPLELISYLASGVEGSVSGVTTVNDAVIPPGYGDTIVKRGKDTIALNNDDTVVAGTNLGGGSNKTGERTNQLLESLIMQNAKKPELSPVGLYEVQ